MIDGDDSSNSFLDKKRPPCFISYMAVKVHSVWKSFLQEMQRISLLYLQGQRVLCLEPYGFLLALVLALPELAFALPMLALPLLVVLTPEVLSLPLLLVTTAVFEGTVLPLVFGFMLALVSTTPLRVALVLLPVAPEFVLSSPPQALHMPATASKQRVAIVRRIFAPSDPD
jgi:hypothetical protein